MNKFIFPILIGLLFAACQNTPKDATTNAVETPAAPPPAPASAAEMQETAVNMTTSAKMLEELRNQVDALPDKLRKENKAEIELMYNNLEGLMVKQNQMVSEINAASNPVGKGSTESQEVLTVTVDAAKIQEYNEATARYAKEAQAMQETIAKIKAGTKGQ